MFEIIAQNIYKTSIIIVTQKENITDGMHFLMGIEFRLLL